MIGRHDVGTVAEGLHFDPQVRGRERGLGRQGGGRKGRRQSRGGLSSVIWDLGSGASGSAHTCPALPLLRSSCRPLELASAIWKMGA